MRDHHLDRRLGSLEGKSRVVRGSVLSRASENLPKPKQRVKQLDFASP